MNSSPSRVLVVDGEEQVRKLLKTVLARAGYEIQTARSVEEVIETWGKSLRFDAVISETVLPGMDGCVLARHLAGVCPDARMIFVSVFETDCEWCPHTPRCVRITKPFNPNEVKRIVAEALTARSQSPD